MYISPLALVRDRYHNINVEWNRYIIISTPPIYPKTEEGVFMGISFKKLETLLSDHGKTFYSLRKDKIVGTETIKKLQQGYGIIDTRTISNLCQYLKCQPGDLMEYVPDKKEE